MGKVDRHLEIELLSALADGELDLSAMRDAKPHLESCADCSAQLASFRRLDDVLLSPAGLSCAGARELRSALLDGELTLDEAAIATRHLDACASCRGEQAAWAAVDMELKGLPTSMPSAATDARVARLVAPAPKPRFPLAGPTALRPLALRGAVAIAVVLAILIGLVPGAGPEQAQPAPEAQTAFVAGVQQVVLYSATNTLYVLQTAVSAVDAVDASSYALRARINVGGKPTALALTASSILVLDPSERSLVEIDPQSNTVVATTQINVAGTLTSMQVDPNNGRVIVSAIADQPAGAVPTPIVTTAENTGVVAVFDPTTKKVEVVSTVDVAPKLVVTDTSGKQTLLVSSSATTVVGANYKKIRTLPGGVSAAFGRSDRIAILSPDPLGAILYLFGDGAPGPLRLLGAPLAVTSVPDVGFAVLLGATSGSGNGRIVVVDEAGRAVGSTDVAKVGRDLAYDPASRKFTVVGGGVIASAAMPAGILADASPAPQDSAAPSPRPSSEAPRATAAPSSTPSASPSVTPSATPSAIVAVPSASPSAPLAAAPSLPPGIPQSASIVGLDLYHVSAGGRVPLLVAATPLKVWFLDTANWLNAINVVTGEVFSIAPLPKDAEISAIAVGADAVYAADGHNSRLFTLDLRTEHLTFRSLPFIGEHTLMQVAPDGRIWFAAEDQSQLTSYDPHGKRVEIVDTGMSGVAAIAVDDLGRVWFTDGDRTLASYDQRSGVLERMRLFSKGAARVLLPDPSGSIWVGTTAGEVISVRGGVQLMPLVAARPISALALDSKGVTWYLTPARAGQEGFVVGRVYGGADSFAVPGAATSLAFTVGGRIWLADAAGGFYLSTDAPK